MIKLFDNQIKAIIFDLGNVLIDIDWQVTYNCLLKHAQVREFDWTAFEKLLHSAERGEIDAQGFRDGLRRLLGSGVSDKQIDDCWNSMIFDFKQERKQLVRELRKVYPVYVLSNINEIHRRYVESQPYWEPQLFTGIFWSCKTGSRKPEKQIYRKVLDEIGAVPQQVLFFDDKEENVESARELGINAILVDRPVEKIIGNFVYVS